MLQLFEEISVLFATGAASEASPGQYIRQNIH